MKRDMDLCRKILAEVETWETTCSPGAVEVDGNQREPDLRLGPLDGNEGLFGVTP